MTQTLPACGALSAWPWVAAQAASSPSRPAGRPLKGFIVSDAHFGWQVFQQPKDEEIRQAIRRIIQRFPDLDVFLDTGDAHHGGADDQCRGRWTDLVPGGCGAIPFYYVPGNHEVDSWGGACDIEWRCAALGSLPCRPYYSLDLKGVHLISLPELLYMCYVSRESVAWLELDLAVNQNKTVLVFTHNAIRGTTAMHDDPGYRSLANSRQILDLLNRYPNILAWMHGHNHTYEMVQQSGKLFVSNGRIGGFIPPDEARWAGKHLGGIYFEIGADYLTARAYSATQDSFLDALGYPHLSQTLHARTSFDAAAPPCISYGSGGAQDGERLTVVHHHSAIGGRRELFLTGAPDPVINENANLAVYAERTHPLAPDRHILPGYYFDPHDDSRWEWLSPGIRVARLAKADDRTTLMMPGLQVGRRSYYPCVPGRIYHAALDLESVSGGQTLHLACRVHDRSTAQVALLDGPWWTLAQGQQTMQADFRIPALTEVDSVYSKPGSDNLFHLMVEARFSNLTHDVVVRRFTLTQADAQGPTTDAGVLVDGKEFRHRGELPPGQLAHFDLPDGPPATTFYELAAAGNRRAAWLVRQTGLQWQVRNAPVSSSGNSLEIGPLRNAFSPRHEVVIAPMGPVDLPFVHRLRNVNRARVQIQTHSQQQRQLAVEVVELLGLAEIDVRTDRQPREVTNAQIVAFREGCLTLSIKDPGKTILTF